ncbi:MAG: CRISPR-associated helicase Cas3' [Thermodesulfobacteriota bacterium]|nr:CRISPR-associated helicase Cas3' [Thermodesulfobacteriota bacterium]
MMNMLPFSETYAHPGDPLSYHLERVAREAKRSLAGTSRHLQLQAVLAGLCHDLGKATWYFQEWRLKQNRVDRETYHSRLGALFFWWLSQGLLLENLGELLRLRLNVLTVILRHHGSLNENQLDTLGRLRERIKDEDELITKQLGAIDLKGICSWFSDQADLLSIPWRPFWDSTPKAADILTAALQPNGLKILMKIKNPPGGPLQDMTAFLAVYGALLAADKIDTALESKRISRAYLAPDLVTNYKQTFFKQETQPSAITVLRCEIAREVSKNLLAHSDCHHFTLTAPTGSGKTLAVLDAVLRLRDRLPKNDHPARIIYCLPFTSVIDQNHQVISDVLKAGNIERSQDILLKHHHLTSPVFRTSENSETMPQHEFDADGAGPLLTETWQSEIVVTTFYQLLHTFFSGKNRHLKRNSQLSGAIVILDEVQAVPLHYWQAISNLFQAASTILHTRFILMTATQPLIFGQEKEIPELLPSHATFFKRLSRMAIHCRQQQQTDLIDFASRLQKDFLEQPQPTLVIVNRRKTVKILYQLLSKKLKGKTILALSTDLTPLDRKERIKNIQTALDKKEALLVISTQLVEAGVDISFPVVHRDLAPLDSIIQSSGRCNRHNEAERGILHLWQLIDSESNSPTTPLWQKIYDSNLIQITQDILQDSTTIPEKDFPSLSRRYFTMCWERSGQIKIDHYLADGDFEKLAEKFKLIMDDFPTVTVFVIQNKTDQKLWDRYLELDEIESALQRRQEFLKYKFDFLERVIQVNCRERQGKEIIAIHAGDDRYNSATGFVALPTYQGPSWTII